MRRIVSRIVVNGLFGMLVIALLVAGCARSQQPAGPTSAASTAGQVSEATAVPASRPQSTPADDTIRLTFVSGESEARYRVREQLARLSLPSDAVGSTRDVAGTIVINPDGTIVAEESKVTVDLRTLKSDEDRRDNFLRRRTLQTDQFPFAEFVPLEARGLPSALPESGAATFQLAGELTIRDVTRQVVWDVTATIEDAKVVGQAQTVFTFADFNLTQPQVPLVLSVEDNIRLEREHHHSDHGGWSGYGFGERANHPAQGHHPEPGGIVGRRTGGGDR